MKAPCKDCPDRHESCHGQCEKYQAYRKERDEMLEERRAYHAAYDARNERVEKAIRHQILWNRRRGK